MMIIETFRSCQVILRTRWTLRNTEDHVLLDHFMFHMFKIRPGSSRILTSQSAKTCFTDFLFFRCCCHTLRSRGGTEQSSPPMTLRSSDVYVCIPGARILDSRDTKHRPAGEDPLTQPDCLVDRERWSG